MRLDTPIYDAIREYIDSKPVPFHMPGHRLGRGIPSMFLECLASLDLTEIPGLDNLHYPDGVIKEAQELAAAAFHADETFFLVNGSTSGIHGMILTLCRKGEKLIISRDCHKSVISGMMLAGVNPVYILPEYDPDFCIPSVISPKALEKALVSNPDAVGVLITRPNYYGVCSNLEEIERIVHSFGKVLAVDEAHGAHLGFSGKLPCSAMQAGADICVQSAHKTLPAFTQGAYLHVKKGRIDLDRVKFALSLLQTSSPSYILMAFLDIARAIMEHHGEELLSRLLKNIRKFRDSLVDVQGFVPLLESDVGNGALDETRIVLNTRFSGKPGFEVERLLRSIYNIQVEMSDYSNIVCIAAVSDPDSSFTALSEALADMGSRRGSVEPLKMISFKDFLQPDRRVEPGEIMDARGRRIKLKEARGRVALRIITPYPPGIPVVFPGEVISEDVIDYIIGIMNSGGIVKGLEGDMEVTVAL